MASLAFYAFSLAPEAVVIGDLDESRLGARIQVVGLVQDARATAGGLLLTLVDPLDGAAVTVFVPRDVQGEGEWTQVVPGAEVLVVGELQLYEGRLEILVTSATDLRILRPPQA